MLLPVALIVLTGACLAAYLGGAALRVETARVRALFERNAKDHVAAVRSGLEGHLESVQVVAGFFAASSDVTRADFDDFTTPLLARHPGIRALEWTPRVDGRRRRELEERARREVPGFAFRDRDAAGKLVVAPPRPLYFPVFYLNPVAGNESALGFSPELHPIRNDTLRRAVATAATALSAPTLLVQGDAGELALIAFAPIYGSAGAGVPAGERARWAALSGLAEGVLSVGSLFDDALRVLEPAALQMELWDVTGEPTLAHRHGGRIAAPQHGAWRRLASDHHLASGFVLGGRSWEIVVTPVAGAYGSDWTAAAAIAATLLALSAVLALFTGATLRRERSVRELVARRTEELSYQATHDALTGLSNRAEFEHRLHAAIERCHDGSDLLTLAYLDLDQFKVVNDSCGHGAGDQMLRELGQLLQSTVRQDDTLARLGGDEFGLLLYGCPAKTACAIAEKLLDRVAGYRFAWGDSVFSVGASIGLVQVDRNTESAAIALSQADAACYVAKENGRGRFHVYAAGDDDVDLFRREMEWVRVIRAALDKSWFVLRQQPIFATAELDREPTFFEILLSLRTPDGELVAPGAFLPAAERFKLMPRIDRWVVDRALHQLAAMGPPPGLVWAINLSGQSLGDATFAEEVVHTLAATGVPAAAVCFEITETAVITNLSAARRFVERLRAAGCRFSLDDFGSGMSSFSYLKQLPVDFVKIDGAFIRGLTDDAVDRVMVRSIHEIARVAGIRTIAECVESEKVLGALRTMAVDFVQGFHLGRPVPVFEPQHEEPAVRRNHRPTGG